MKSRPKGRPRISDSSRGRINAELDCCWYRSNQELCLGNGAVCSNQKVNCQGAQCDLCRMNRKERFRCRRAIRFGTCWVHRVRRN